MIDEHGPVRVIMNDEPDNAPGDFACVRIEVSLDATHAAFVRDDGWALVGFGYVAKCLSKPSYVDLVYRFGGGAS